MLEKTADLFSKESMIDLKEYLEDAAGLLVVESKNTTTSAAVAVLRLAC